MTELAEPFRISLNSVSKHIRILERAGLVQRRVRGREHILSFRVKPLAAAADWIETRRELWADRLQTLDELLQEEDRNSRRRRQSWKSR